MERLDEDKTELYSVIHSELMCREGIKMCPKRFSGVDWLLEAIST